MAADRTFGAGFFIIDLDGERVGDVSSIAGGSYTAEISATIVGATGSEQKSVTSRGAAPVALTTTLPLRDGAFSTWISSAIAGRAGKKKSADVTFTDRDFKARHRMHADGMLVTRVVIPKLDAASREAARCGIELTPDRIDWKVADGAKVQASPVKKAKVWLSSNFRLTIGALPCERVSTIEGLSWSSTVIVNSANRNRANVNDAGTQTISDFTITISKTDLNPWLEKANGWFLDGKCLEQDEMTATIIMLAPDLKAELGRIDLMNVGFKAFDVNGPRVTGGNETVQPFTVTLYAEQMRLSFKP